MQCQNKVLDGSSWLLEEILNCTALSGKHNRRHRVQLLTFPGDTRVYIWDGFHYIRAMFLSANAVDLRHNLLENWPPGTVLHLVSYYYDFNTGQPEDEELAFSLVIEHFFDDGNSSLGLDILPPTEKLHDVCAFAGKLEVTEPRMKRKTKAVETDITLAPSVSRCDQERGENDNSSSIMVSQANPPDGIGRGSGRRTKDWHSDPHTRTSLFTPVEMEDLVVTPSQLNLMSFSSFNDELQDDVPSRSESVSELFEELGRESSNEDQPQREDRDEDKLKITHIFKSGDGKSKQIFHTPLTSVDRLMVSLQEEWQLSLIPDWMPGCRPEPTSSSSSNCENAGSHSYHEPLFLHPTLDSGNPLSHVSTVTVKKRRDGGSAVSLGERVDVVADISKQDDAAFSSQNSSRDQPLTSKVKGVSSSPPMLAKQGRGNEGTSQPSGEGKTAALSGDSDSLFSDAEAEEVSPATMQNDGGSDLKLRRQISKSGSCVEKMKKIISSNKDAGSVRTDGSRPQDLLCEQGGKGTHVDSSNLYKVLKRVISTSRLQSSTHTADSPQNMLNPPEKRRATGECLDTIEQSPFEDSEMEKRFQIIDDCLLNVLQDLVEPVKSCKDDRRVPQSKDSMMSMLTGDTVVVGSSENRKSAVVQNADTDRNIHLLTKSNLGSPQTLRRASETKKRLFTVGQNYADVNRSGVEQMEQSSRKQAKAQHPLNMLLTNLSTKQQSSDLCVTATENPLQLQSGHKGASEIQREITLMQPERMVKSRVKAGGYSEWPEVATAPKPTEASKSKEEKLMAEPPHKKLQAMLHKAFSSKLHKTTTAKASSAFPQQRLDVRGSNVELRSNKRQLTRITRWFRPEQNEEGETFSEIPAQSNESVVSDTVATKCKRKRLRVAIKNVPSDCAQVLDIKRGILISDDVLNNIELMRLFQDGQTFMKVNVKEEIIDSSDDISETSSLTSEKEERNHINESKSKSQKHCSVYSKYSGSLKLDKRKRIPSEVPGADKQGDSELWSKKKLRGLSVHDLPESVVKVRRIPSKPTEVFNELTAPSASGQSSPGRGFIASLAGESQGFLPQIEACERLGSDEGW